jgi:hypothetical protein
MVRPSRWAFFQFKPLVATPTLNGGFIPLAGSLDRFLATPIDFVQYQ